MTAVVRADGLTKTYKARGAGQGVRALDGMTFEVAAGSVFALLGPNGAGKSTTVRILTTLARPDAGRATVDGIDVTADPASVRRRIGVVTQDSGSVPHLTGRENLVLQGRIYGLRRRQVRERADELLGRFDLLDAADRIVGGYSGGMRRRLDLCLGLVHAPRILFLDEPTTGLDPEARVGAWQALADLAIGQDGFTVVLTTHYLEEADAFAARVAIVDQGRLVVEGTPEELKATLRGDAVALTVASPDDLGAAGAALERMLGARPAVDGTVLTVRSADGAQALPGLLSHLDASGVAVASVRVSRPSLDDVYLHFAGRSFATASAGQEVAA